MESLTETTTDAVRSVCRDGRISETVVRAVAQATGTDVLELDPLYYVVDPDALNRLFDADGTSQPSPMELTFTMAGCEVVVRGDGEVVVTPPADGDVTPTVIGSREE